VRCRYYARRLHESGTRSSRVLRQSDRYIDQQHSHRDVYATTATTPCVIKDALQPPGYELHFQTAGPSPGWTAGRLHACQRRGVDSEHDYESMDDDTTAGSEPPSYPAAGLTDATGCGLYQTAVGVETVLRPGYYALFAPTTPTRSTVELSRVVSVNRTDDATQLSTTVGYS